MSRCFVRCLWQARKRCSNGCRCCGLRSNYASDVRPTDPLAAGIECPSPTLAPGVVFCTSTAELKYNKKNRVIFCDFTAVKLLPWWAEAVTASAKVVTAKKLKTAYRRNITAILWFYRLRRSRYRQKTKNRLSPNNFQRMVLPPKNYRRIALPPKKYRHV